MLFIADLHIHSRYSLATSKDMSLENLWKWSQLKGISVIGTGDFTHFEWFKELNKKLEPLGNGLFKLKKEFMRYDVPDLCRGDVYFMLTAEVSNIYIKKRLIKKIHSIILVPDFENAYKINKALAKIGNLNTDGRPTLSTDVKEVLKIVLNEATDALLIPAHAWTPHFSIFGAKSGFDSIDECFEEFTPYVYSIETGLSSDPPMNWRLSALDKITLISNSDAHSPSKIGREANIFDTELSYKAIINAIKTRNGFIGTLEFFPEEGKYHYDGHRACGLKMSPSETIRHNYLCPVCGKRVTIGVLHRVERLADRDEGYRPVSAPSFYSIIPLPEIIAEVLNVRPNSASVNRKYQELLQKLGSELKILLDIPLEDIKKADSALLAEAISRVRKRDVCISPGFDGEYGKIKIFEKAVKSDAGF